MSEKQIHMFLFLCFVSVSIIGFGIIGCGVKSPPKPPIQEVPNPVTDLTKTITGSIIVLTWSVPLEKEHAAVERFSVLRSKTGKDDYCPGCPLFYTRIADISVGSGLWQDSTKGTVSYSEGLETGNRYSYKVIGYTWDNVASIDSNLVEFDF